MSAGRTLGRGLLGALLAALLWIVVPAVPGIWTVLSSRLSGTSGSASVLMDSNHLLIAAIIGFVAGVWWARRRR